MLALPTSGLSGIAAPESGSILTAATYVSNDTVAAAMARLTGDERFVYDCYRRLVQKWHPDRYQQHPDQQHVAAHRMLEINEAYGILAQYYRQHGQLPFEPPRRRFAQTETGPAFPPGPGVSADKPDLDFDARLQSLQARMARSRLFDILPWLIIASILATPVAASPPAKPRLTNIQKIRKIEETIDQEIRPSLRKDGGDIELIDVIGNRVVVATRGACAVCQASQQTLKNFVEAKLRELVWPDLTVEEVTP